MRLCRYERQGDRFIGFFEETKLFDAHKAAQDFRIAIPDSGCILPWLTCGSYRTQVQELANRIAEADPEDRAVWEISTDKVKLLVPIPRPSKLLLLAGNYSKHIEEGGGRAAERAETFPYVFMKPPSTTLTHPGDPVRIPEVSPHHIDWEIELGVVIGARCKNVTEGQALKYVAGYTIVNDISDRKFRPNPDRVQREKDGFFDWLHGKWHDTFCPMGPCILPADELPDPQTLRMVLKLNGEVRQDASTGEMVFPVAAVVSFISRFVTLEPGDIISTGTPHGVGAASKTFLKPGDLLEASIERIGILRNPVC